MTTDRATVGHNLRPLERDGLLEIKVSAADRRMREVTLTKRGNEMLLAAYPAWRRAQDGFESCVDGFRGAADLRYFMAQVIETPLPGLD